MYLEGSLGMSVVEHSNEGWRGSNESSALRSNFGWINSSIVSTNSSGFSANPGGYRDGNITYYEKGELGYWWSNTENDPLFRALSYQLGTIFRGPSAATPAYSVRCLKEDPLTYIYGCMDTNACNFLPDAIVYDGSCLYPNATCDDGDVNTVNDVINGECVCGGTILPPPLFTMGNGVTDIDGNFYPSIIINGQEWTQKNLTVSRYRNGDVIPYLPSYESWFWGGACAVYNNEMFYDSLYGKLYNGYAVNDTRGLCPTGWHVPSDAEWSFLINFLDPNSAGGAVPQNTAGGKMKSNGTIELGDGLWHDPNVEATNLSGFSALPGGFYDLDTPDIFLDFVGYYGAWWTSSYDGFSSLSREILFNQSGVDRVDNPAYYGLSVRCIRD
jgi:uncharacterized protein (TIGR02145 family)